MFVVYGNILVNLRNVRYVSVRTVTARVEIEFEMIPGHAGDDDAEFVMVFYTEEELNEWLEKNASREGFEVIAETVKKYADFDRAYKLLKEEIQTPYTLKYDKYYIEEALSRVKDDERRELLEEALKALEVYEKAEEVLDKIWDLGKSAENLTDEEIRILLEAGEYKMGGIYEDLLRKVLNEVKGGKSDG